jgi:purine-binding chemotaxis protein CheW
MTTKKRASATPASDPDGDAVPAQTDAATTPEPNTVAAKTAAAKTAAATTATAKTAAPKTGAAQAGAVDGAASADQTRDDADTGTADFVTFVVEGETYAFPMERVEEIIRMPETVRVPLGPPSLEGLANLRGRILPIVSLRACCGLPEAPHDEATRVIVVDGGATLGFVVDRVASVTSVEVNRVEPVDQIRSVIDSDLLSGVIKPGRRADEKDAELTKILDVPRLVASQFESLAEHATRSRAQLSDTGRGLHGVAVGEADDDGDDATLELVSFAVDGQEYALPLDRVQEIVQAPERVTTVPNAEARVLGVMDLRGRLMPVVSLRQVFGLAPAPLEPQNRIVVVQLPALGGRDAGNGSGDQSGNGSGNGSGGTAGDVTIVGVVMDTVREVLRVPYELVADLPEFMARAGRAQEVESVCRLEDGKRLVSVLSVEQMFARDDLESTLRTVAGGVDHHAGTSDHSEEGVMARELLDRAGPTDDETGDDELLVVFRLAAEEYSVDVDAVQEIIRVPETLIRVPKALDFVEGLVNLRGAVLPVVDLRTRLGLARTERDERQRIVVLIVNGMRTGFIVDSVTEVLRVTRSLLEPAPELSEEQARLVKQVANLASSQRMLMLLETDQLLATEQVAALIPHQRAAVAGELVG